MERKQPDLVLIVARSFATKLATPTLITDARGDLVYFNDAAAEVIGRSYLDIGQLPASRWQELFEPRTLDEQPLTAAANAERRCAAGAEACSRLVCVPRTRRPRAPHHRHRVPAFLAPRRGRRRDVDLLGAPGGSVIVRVWGARGSLSAPGPATVGYGGNTSCVEVEFADGTTLILDAGSGIRELGQRIAERDPDVLHLCLTHLHLDHVEGLGFFEPLWTSGWKLRFWGPPSATMPLRDRVARYLSPPLFPVGLAEAPAEAVFEDVPREPWRVGSAVIEAQTVEHRGANGRLPDRGGGPCPRLPPRPRAVPDRRAR